jgi:hypothetical protein
LVFKFDELGFTSQHCISNVDLEEMSEQIVAGVPVAHVEAVKAMRRMINPEIPDSWDIAW